MGDFVIDFLFFLHIQRRTKEKKYIGRFICITIRIKTEMKKNDIQI